MTTEDQRIERERGEISMTPMGHLIRPFKLLVNYGLGSILVTVIFAFLSYYALFQLDLLLSDTLVELAKEGRVPKRAEMIFKRLLSFLCWFPSLPIFIVASLLPLRVLFKFGPPSLSRCAGEIPGAMYCAGQGFFYSWRPLVVLSIPIISLSILISQAESSSRLLSILPLLVIVAITLAIMVAWKIILPLSSIPISISTGIHPIRFLSVAGSVIYGARKASLLVLYSAFLGTLGLLFLIANRDLTILDITADDGIILICCALLTIEWYLTTLIAVICLDPVVDRLAAENARSN